MVGVGVVPEKRGTRSTFSQSIEATRHSLSKGMMPEEVRQLGGSPAQNRGMSRVQLSPSSERPFPHSTQYSVWLHATGTELARVTTLQPLPHAEQPNKNWTCRSTLAACRLHMQCSLILPIDQDAISALDVVVRCGAAAVHPPLPMPPTKHQTTNAF